MNPRTRSRMPASIGSNQASPANSAGPSACVLVLSCSMAWSPPALERRKWLVEQARDYATNPFPPHPRRHPQRRVDPLPGAVPTPLGIVVEHCCPGRKVVRQGAPLTSSAEQVEHGLDDAAQCEDLWMSRLLSLTKQRCKDRPFRVAQVG